MAEPTSTAGDRRASSSIDRLSLGMFTLYQRATAAKKSDLFNRNENTWGAFEQAVLPELQSFSFTHKTHRTPHTPSSALSDSMYQIWTLEKLGGSIWRPTTIQVTQQLAKHIHSTYEVEPLDRRARKRASLGLDVVA